MNPKQTDECWRKRQTTHVFWACLILKDFWRGVFEVLNKVFDLKLPRDPLLDIVGVVPKELRVKKRKYFLQTLLAAAKKEMTLNWLKVEPPPHDKW